IQRVDSIGNMLWTANGVQLTEDAGADIWQAYPRLCSDNEGGAIVAWVDQRDSDYDCYAQRVDGSGVARWTANGVPVCVAEESCDEIALVAGPDKSAILIWEDFRSGVGKDIYTQQLDSLGIAQWDENGIALCLAANSQYDPRAVTDNAGGAIVTWYDERVFGDPDIYAHRITHQGDIAATLLQGFFASCRDEAVFIEWTLSELDPGTRFTVYRAVLPGNDYYPLPEDNISREGLTFSYRDGDCSPGSTYSYQVEVESRGVKRFLFRTDPITPPAAEFVLHQNYPNPFNPSTTISYYLPEKCRVTLRIYDSAGREVCRLLDGFQEAGPRSLTWAGMNGCGEPVQSGVYYYSLTAGKETRSRKMLLLR
nr:T9SS type A sorting domain-containing protein [Candidatus Krumholzibacteriota bacterium]